MRLVTAAQMRELDRRAIQERGIPSVDLMESAAGRIVEAIRTALRLDGPGQGMTCAVFAGPGNNGGDGTAVAWLLRKEGWNVRVFLVGDREKLTPDHREMVSRFESLGGLLEELDAASGRKRDFILGADVVVDAIFGVGLNSPLREPALTAVDLINRVPGTVFSADIPSGVETDTGRILGGAVQADYTVTFSFAKPGHFVGKGALCTGKLLVRDIGIPADLMEEVTTQTRLMTSKMAAQGLSQRARDAHKGDFGKVLIVGGSVGFTGAPVLASRGALRSGTGLVTVAVPQEVWPVVAVKCDEAMARPLGKQENTLALAWGCDALLVGPGLGRSDEARELVRLLCEKFEGPLVLDADGINALEGHIDVLDSRKGRTTVLTPHDGEFARLGGDLTEGDRLGEARAFAAAHGCYLVLKGHNTITACPNGLCYVNATGNPGMAVGGSGDVLAGVVLSLLGQGLAPERAAALAVYLHGRAGDLAAEDLGEYGMIPTDLVARLPRAIKEITE